MVWVAGQRPRTIKLSEGIIGMSSYYKNIATFIGGIVLVVPRSPATNNVKFAEAPGDRVEIRLSFDSATEAPKGYTIEQPARIVLDFPNVDNSLAQRNSQWVLAMSAMPWWCRAVIAPV